MHPVRSILCAAMLATCAVAQGEAAQRPLADFTLANVAPGVFVASPTEVDHFFVEPNVTFVVGEESVLVVDSGYLPSTARRVADLLRSVTELPVRYLVNTHWHGDHLYGNQGWLEAFPDLEFVASAAGAEEMATLGVADVQAFLTGRYGQGVADLREEIEAARSQSDASRTSEELTEMEARLRAFEQTLGELRALRVITPGIMFIESLRLDLGGIEAHVMHLGSANTAGDSLVYLPARQLLITGDVVVHPRPYPSGDDFDSWLTVLDEIQRMDVELLVPGHGQVQRDTRYVGQVAALYRVLLEMVGAERAQGRDAETTRAAISIERVEQVLLREFGLEPGHFGLTDGWLDWAVGRVFAAINTAARS